MAMAMAMDERISTESSATKRVSNGNTRNGLLVGAAAAVLVLVVGLASWAVIAGDDDGAVASEVSVALAFYETRNNGDIDGHLELFSEDATGRVGPTSLQVLVNMNSQTEFVEPCRLLEPSPASGLARVVCKVSATSDFHTPGGIQMIRTGSFQITDAGKIDIVAESFDSPSATESSFFAYNRAFWQWLDLAHPDVADVITPVDGESMPGWPNEPEHVPTALDFVDEFIAQSDVYPLSEATTP